MSINRNNVFYPKTETRLSDSEILSLRDRYDRFDADIELSKICQYVFHKKPIKYNKIIAWGLDHILYDVKLDDLRIVVRINQTSVEDDYFEIEKYVYNKLIDLRIQECQVYHVEKRGNNFSYDFIILDKLMVGDFEKILQDGDYNSQEELKLVKASGSFLLKIHSVNTEKFGFFDISKLDKGLIGEKNSWEDYYLTAFDKNLATLVQSNYIDITKSQLIRTTVNNNKSLFAFTKPVLLHGDFCDHNIISNMTSISGAIDWTDAISGDPIHDIAFWSSFYPKERLNIFLEGYYGSASQPKDFWDKLNIYRLRINVSKALLRHKYGIPERVPLAIQKIDECLDYFKIAPGK